MHPWHYLRGAYPTNDARAALATVPADAVLFTHDEWFAHVAARFPNATLFPRDRLDYIVVAGDYPSAIFQERYRPQLAGVIAREGLVVRSRFGHVLVYGPSTSSRLR